MYWCSVKKTNYIKHYFIKCLKMKNMFLSIKFNFHNIVSKNTLNNINE